MKDYRFLKPYFEKLSLNRKKWLKRNRYYHKILLKHFRFIIPQDSTVLEIGCGTGDLLHGLKPKVGYGIDFSEGMIAQAKSDFHNLNFQCIAAEEFKTNESFDFVVMSDLLCSLWDIQAVFKQLNTIMKTDTKMVISVYNYHWEPVLRLAEKLGLKAKQPLQNWLTVTDIQKLLHLEGYELIRLNKKMLFPKYITIVSYFFNSFLANLPLINRLSLVSFITARKIPEKQKDYSVSIVVPARNERGNIENAIKRTPQFGTFQEFIFIEGNSSDSTYDEMIRVQQAYPEKQIVVTKQSGKGKGNAVREAFDIAKGDILMILDADLTMPPEDLLKFYDAIKSGKGEFINGCRLVYPMEKEAMRFLNYLGNKFFSWFLSFLLDQQLKDTLCGTKVLFKHHYKQIEKNRSYFGDFDPFGDFDLLFGAAKLNLKITEVIVRYRDREYGTTQISRFRHGWLLIKMSIFAARKIKFI
ncbi:MAG: methyltransferase domain-containing protein [Salinivirgaceae bacterium]